MEYEIRSQIYIWQVSFQDNIQPFKRLIFPKVSLFLVPWSTFLKLIKQSIMKSKFTLFLLLIVVSIQAQLRITEISYNPPESMQDSLEYIELYNTSDIEIDLTGYIIADNNQDTLSGGLVAAGGYVIVASNTAAIMNVFGIAAIAIPNVALRNGGEAVSILTPSGEVLDMVEYSPDAPWPTFMDGTSGEGASIELCNLDSDGNIGSNWKAADNDLGIMLNDKAVKGTPAAANTTTCAAVPDVTTNDNNTFTPADITINVNETVTWGNTGGFHNVNGSLNAYPDNPEGFTNGSASGDLWTFQHTFSIAGVYDYRCDPHFNLGMVGTVTVIGAPDPTFPRYDVATITTNDAAGVPDSIGRPVGVVGVAHGINFRSGGLQFTLIDDNGDGIGVFSNSENFGIDYEEGMEILVEGNVSQFSGLTQIAAENVEMMSTGNDLTDATAVSSPLSEDTESQLVVIAGLTFVDEGEWGNGNDFGFNATMTDGTNEYNLRIDNDSPLFEAPLPETPAAVTGIGGQFDQSSPFDEGYQLAPRYMSDFDAFIATSDEITENIAIYPNPVSAKLNIDTDVKIDLIEITNNLGQLIFSTRGTDRLDVSGLDKGIYFVHIHSGDKSKVLQFSKN